MFISSVREFNVAISLLYIMKNLFSEAKIAVFIGRRVGLARCYVFPFDRVWYISVLLLKAAISFASQFVCISQQEIEIIFHAKKSLLYNNSTPWCKRTDTPNFDVTMGSFDGAETCQLVGLYLLSDI